MYQVIGLTNLNEIKKWDKIKNSSRWVNVNFHAQRDNRQTDKPLFLRIFNKKQTRSFEFYSKTCGLRQQRH